MALIESKKMAEAIPDWPCYGQLPDAAFDRDSTVAPGPHSSYKERKSIDSHEIFVLFQNDRLV